MTDEDDVPSALRDGRYRGMHVLGRGAQATTFAAVDVGRSRHSGEPRVRGRPVAIKRFLVRGARSWKEVELAEREANVLASLSHPLLPSYVEHFEEGGALYLVTGKIEGESLQQIRSRGGRLDEAEIARLLRDLGEVLGYLHGRAPPIIHRDVKPGNIVRTTDGRYALVDFGAVRDRLRPEGGSTVVGTFGYMAPEQFQGRAMPQSDVYGVGATVLTMLTGQEPEALPHRGLAIDVRAALGRGAKEALIEAVERMLDPDPDRRAARVPQLLEESAPTRKKRGRPRDGADDDRRDRDPPRRGRARTAKDEKRARKRADRDRRKAAAWRRRARVAGGLSRMAVAIALLVAIIAVQIACRVLVPTVLVTLSVFFGESLRRAARQVAVAGVRATYALERARDLATGLRLPDEDADLDAEADGARRGGGARIDVDAGGDAAHDLAAEEEEIAAADSERVRGARGRGPD